MRACEDLEFKFKKRKQEIHEDTNIEAVMCQMNKVPFRY